jgi:hypothetical protein
MMISLKTLEFGSFRMSAADEWEDITASLDDRDAPFTVARSKRGVGAIQFSPAIYRGGPTPSLSPKELGTMLAEFGNRRHLGEPFDNVPFSGSVFGIGSSFRSGNEFVRVWYLSDGQNVMLATYVCDWSKRFDESEDREEIVRSVRFNVTGREKIP